MQTNRWKSLLAGAAAAAMLFTNTTANLTGTVVHAEETAPVDNTAEPSSSPSAETATPASTDPSVKPDATGTNQTETTSVNKTYTITYSVDNEDQASVTGDQEITVNGTDTKTTTAYADRNDNEISADQLGNYNIVNSDTLTEDGEEIAYDAGTYTFTVTTSDGFEIAGVKINDKSVYTDQVTENTDTNADGITYKKSETATYTISNATADQNVQITTQSVDDPNATVTLKTEVNGIRVIVEGTAAALPKDGSVSAVMLDEEQTQQAVALVQENLDQQTSEDTQTEVQSLTALDITILDSEENTVTIGASVSVRFENTAADQAVQEAEAQPDVKTADVDVYHISEDTKGNLTGAESMDATQDGSDVIFETDHFSIYMLAMRLGAAPNMKITGQKTWEINGLSTTEDQTLPSIKVTLYQKLESEADSEYKAYAYYTLPTSTTKTVSYTFYQGDTTTPVDNSNYTSDNNPGDLIPSNNGEGEAYKYKVEETFCSYEVSHSPLVTNDKLTYTDSEGSGGDLGSLIWNTTKSDYNLKNTYTNDSNKGSAVLKKEWIGLPLVSVNNSAVDPYSTDGDGKYPYPSLTFTMYRGTESGFTPAETNKIATTTISSTEIKTNTTYSDGILTTSLPASLITDKIKNAGTDFYIFSPTGAPYYYAIQETAISGYNAPAAAQYFTFGSIDAATSKYTINSNRTISFTNTFKLAGETVTITGTKQWDDLNDALGLRPSVTEPKRITLELWRGAETEEGQGNPITFTKLTDGTDYSISWNNWAYTFSSPTANSRSLQKYAPNGTPYVYEVREYLADNDGRSLGQGRGTLPNLKPYYGGTSTDSIHMVSTAEKTADEKNKYTVDDITNSLTGTFNVTKVWSGFPDNITKDRTAYVQLQYRLGTSGTWLSISELKNNAGNEVYKGCDAVPLTVSASLSNGSVSASFDYLPLENATGIAYQYRVVELSKYDPSEVTPDKTSYYNPDATVTSTNGLFKISSTTTTNSSGGTTTITNTARATGTASVSFNKIYPDGNNYSGATFTLYRANDQKILSDGNGINLGYTVTDGSKAWLYTPVNNGAGTIVSTAAGVVSAGNLPLGTYYFVEDIGTRTADDYVAGKSQPVVKAVVSETGSTVTTAYSYGYLDGNCLTYDEENSNYIIKAYNWNSFTGTGIPVLTNELLYGYVNINKTAEDGASLLNSSSGVTFSIYKSSDKNNPYVSGIAIDANGNLAVDANHAYGSGNNKHRLYYGDYILKETSTASNLILDGNEYEFTIGKDTTGSGGTAWINTGADPTYVQATTGNPEGGPAQTTEVTSFVNTAVRAPFSFSKISFVDQTVLKNAAFSVYVMNADGTRGEEIAAMSYDTTSGKYVLSLGNQTIKKNSSGISYFLNADTGLLAGYTYLIDETTVQPGYYGMSFELQVAENNKTAELSITNQKTLSTDLDNLVTGQNGNYTVRNIPVNMILVKSDNDSNPLDGTVNAQFEVKPAESGTWADGTSAPITVTYDLNNGTPTQADNTRTALLAKIKLGQDYTITETKSPDGYLLDQTAYTVAINADGSTISPVDSQFSLNVNNVNPTDLVRTIKGDVNNVPIKVGFKKTDMGNTVLSSTALDITGVFAGSNESVTKRVATTGTGSLETTFSSQLICGNVYQVVEATVPAGYTQAFTTDSPLYFKVVLNSSRNGTAVQYSLDQEHWSDTVTKVIAYGGGTRDIGGAKTAGGDAESKAICIQDAPVSLTFKKTDMSGNPLAGAIFTLRGKFADDKTQTVDKTLTSASDGSLRLDQQKADSIEKLLIVDEVYTLTETKAPEGYILAGDYLNDNTAQPVTSQVTFKIDPDGMINVQGDPVFMNESVSMDGSTLSVENGEAKVRFTTLDSEDGKAISGVKFTLSVSHESNGVTGTKDIYTENNPLVTDKNGVALTEELGEGVYVLTKIENSGSTSPQFTMQFEIKKDELGGPDKVIDLTCNIANPKDVTSTELLRNHTPDNGFVVTFLDCSGNTVSVQTVAYQGSALPPTGYGSYAGYSNVSAHLDLKPTSCSGVNARKDGYVVPNTADRN